MSSLKRGSDRPNDVRGAWPVQGFDLQMLALRQRYPIEAALLPVEGNHRRGMGNDGSILGAPIRKEFRRHSRLVRVRLSCAMSSLDDVASTSFLARLLGRGGTDRVDPVTLPFAASGLHPVGTLGAWSRLKGSTTETTLGLRGSSHLREATRLHLQRRAPAIADSHCGGHP